MANQSEITSPKAGKSRLRPRAVAPMTGGKNVVRREEGGNGNPFKRLIVFMRLRYR